MPNFTFTSEGCMTFIRSHEVYAKQEPIVVRIVEARHFEKGNMTVHPCDFPATKNDLVALRSGTVFVVNDPCVSVEWIYSKKKDCAESVMKFEETPISDFCKQSPTDSLCDKYAPGVVSPSTGVKELEKLDSGASTTTTTTRSPSPSTSPSSARRVSTIFSLVVASLAVVTGAM